MGSAKIRKLLIILAAGVVFATAYWLSTFADGDAGPFYAKQAPLPARAPDQTFRTFNGFVLEVFDPRGEQKTPIVALLANNKMRWAVYVEESAPIDTKIRFDANFSFPVFKPRVRGNIYYNDTAYGRTICETVWHFSDSGEFEYYSVYT